MFNKITTLLKKRGVGFEVLEHAPTRTSQESASTRNTPLEWGSKTMVVKGKEGLVMLLYRADRRVSWNKMRKLP